MSGGVETLEAAYYWYDGDGNMVKREINGVVTYYVGKHYEKQVDGVTETFRKYYTANGQTLAMREDGTLTWLLSDHLGSTSVTADASGGLLSSMRYTAFGETRAASGTTNTDYHYTGQREESELGLYYYVARWYDPALARFIQADSIVPGAGNPVAWDRYAYTLNNPIKYVDPSGHFVEFPQVIDFSNFYIPFNNGWDLLGAAISYVVSPVLPVHFESYGLGRGAIVGDTQAQIMEKGMMLFGVPNAISGIVPTRPFTVTSKPAPASRTPNEIGAWGEQQVGKNLPARIQQNRVTDPITGQTRIYDGSFIANQGAYIEVKTSTQPIIYASKSIKNQIAFDAGFGSNSGTMPVWIFVNGQPSRPLINLLQRNNIPWQQLHVPQ